MYTYFVVSCKDNLDPGPEACAGLRQGVPGKGPHHLLHLMDQILGFVAYIALTHNSETPRTK
jgi:hypothetical protein